MNLHNIRTFQLSNELVESYPYFISELIDQSLNYTRVKQKDFSIIQILRLLECLNDGEESYAKLFRRTGWGLKKSFINYMHFCLHFHLTKKERLGHFMMYSLTEKGKIFLDLFRNASS